MSTISASAVKQLRDRTGMQMMACKAALVEANGDMEKAVEILRKKSKDAVDKSAGRETAEGRVAAFIDPAKRVGAIIEVRCESAPVAKGEHFVRLANELAKQVATRGAKTPEELLAQPFVDQPGKSVADHIGELVGLIRENMKPARMARLEGLLGEYIHHNGSVGALVQVEGEKADSALLRDVCMHIVSKNPVAAVREDVPADKIAKEMEIARAQAAEQGKGKPQQIIEKIAEGKMRTWYAENVLTEQPFVKEESKTVGELLKGAGLKLVRFVRYRVGDIS